MKTGSVPILAATSDVAGVPGGVIFHSSSTSLTSEECGERAGGEENDNVARYDRSQFLSEIHYAM